MADIRRVVTTAIKRPSLICVKLDFPDSRRFKVMV